MITTKGLIIFGLILLFAPVIGTYFLKEYFRKKNSVATDPKSSLTKIIWKVIIGIFAFTLMYLGFNKASNSSSSSSNVSPVPASTSSPTSSSSNLENKKTIASRK